MGIAAAVSMAILGSAVPSVQAVLYEPPGNQVLFGAWIDTQAGFSDTPTLFNQRLGQYVPVYQIAQVIPLPPYNYTTGAGGAAPENLLEESSTDAAIFLTVYPVNGFGYIQQSDYDALAQQVLGYQELDRTVFIRYAPEMQGKWFSYGQQPTAFNASYHALYNAVKAVTPNTIMVWAPNTPQGYPYGQTLEGSSAADIALLDTNGDGTLSAADDALAPYYPGDDVVDWVGLSLYYKGSSATTDSTNAVQAAGYCSDAINGIDPSTGRAITNWYQTYCAAKPQVACMLAESGAAYHVNDAGTGTQETIMSAWISDCITNVQFLDTFPRLKLIINFEYIKVETDNSGDPDLRDYRLTNNTAVLGELVASFSSIGTRFSWANSRAPPTSISSPGAAAPNTNSVGSTIVQQITNTLRARPTTFPQLFGSTSDGTQRAELIELGVLVSSGIFGALAVMKYL